MDDHAPTLVDAIRGALGFEQLSLELIDRVARDRATVREIADAARFWAESSTLPPVPDGTLRPFMEARHWADRGPAGLNVLNGTAQLWSELYNPDAVPRAVDAVKCHLLYCHSIALTTPLDPRYAPDDHNRSSRQFVAGLQVLAELAPLIDARIVHFAPHLRHGSDDFYPLVREAFAHVTQGAPLTKATDPFGPLPAADMKAIREDVAAQRYPSEWSDFASAEEALKDWIRRTRENRLFSVLRAVVGSLLSAAALQQRVDLYLPSRRSRTALGWIVNATKTPLSRPDAVASLRFMPDLLTTQLPGGVRELSLAEIIAIRRDGVFDDWRRMLGNALNDVAQVHADELVHDEVIRQSLADKLAEATATVRAQAAKGSVLSRLRSATVDLSVSTAIGLGATEIIHTEVAGVGVGGVTLLAKAVLDWWRGRPRAGQRALLRHAAVFTQPAVSS